MSEADNSTQWPLNQAAYQNMANDQVDWAALAQQWIHMKETCTTDQLLAAPPPPIISKQDFEEQGEAPMEVEKEDEQHNLTQFSSNTNATPDAPTWQPGWQGQGQQNQWRKKPGWNTWTNPNIPPPLQQPQQSLQPLPPNPFANSNSDSFDVRSDGYWQRFSNNSNNADRIDIKPANNHLPLLEPQLPTPLDAAKRKTLPTWIRQGLEKMEREKQKQAEKERELKERASMIEQRKTMEQDLNAITGDRLVPIKSKFDSDSDEEDAPPKKELVHLENSFIPRSKIPYKSKQEQLLELMLMVRSSLTEILLDVTNEEIRNISTETLSKMRLKARSAHTVKKTALSSITGGLGLGIYGDSDNSSAESSDDEDANKSKHNSESEGNNSEIELQETIKRRKSSFEIKSKEIEAQLAVDEEKERRWLEDDVVEHRSSGSGGGSGTFSHVNHNNEIRSFNNDKETGEIQHEKNNLTSLYGRSTNERKASRFSDPKDTVKNLHVTHGSIIYETLTSAVNSHPPSIIKNAASDNGANNSQDYSTSSSKIVRSTSYQSNSRKERNSKDSSDSTNSSSASKSKRNKYSKSRRAHSSSEDSDDTRYDSRKYNSKSRRRRSRSSSSERSYRSSSHKNYKSYSRSDSKKSSSSYYDDRGGDSKRSYDRQRSREKSSSSKYDYDRKVSKREKYRESERSSSKMSTSSRSRSRSKQSIFGLGPN